MPTGALHHVELYVSNLARSKAFWGDLLTHLGYEKFQEWAEGISWKLDATYIVLVQAQERFLSPEYHRCRVGLNHIAFHADSRSQVDAIVPLLKRHNLLILYEAEHPYAGGVDHYALYFEDPDRIKVEIVASTIHADE